MDSSFQLQIAITYIIAAFAGGWIWDLLLTIREDYHVVTEFRISSPTVVFVLSRVVTFTFIILTVFYNIFFYTMSEPEKIRLSVSMAWFYALIVPLNCLQFLFRVGAIFQDSRWVIYTFTFFWLGTFAAFLLTPIFCTAWGEVCAGSTLSIIMAGIIAVTIYDTSLYIAVATRLTKLSSPKGPKGYVKAFFGGAGMGRISRSLFVSGQIYYLIVVVVNVLSTVGFLIGLNSTQDEAVATVIMSACLLPNAVLQNALACRVYRELKLGVIPDHTLPALGHQQVATID